VKKSLREVYSQGLSSLSLLPPEKLSKLGLRKQTKRACDVKPLETMSEQQQIIKGPDIGIEKPETKPLKTKPQPAGPTPPKPPKKAPPKTNRGPEAAAARRAERLEKIAFWIGVAAALLGLVLYLWAHFSK
jgi:hypothetical protein